MPHSTTGVIVIAHGQWFAEVAGLPLLHRVLLGGGKAGVRRWIVFAQHEAQWVRSNLATAYKLRDIAWQVQDLRAEVAELRSHGVEVQEYDMPGLKTEDGIADLGFAWMAWIIDPGGNALAIMQLKA